MRPHMEADGWAVEETHTTGSDHLPMWFSINPSALHGSKSPLQSRLNWKKADSDSQKLPPIRTPENEDGMG